MAAKLTGMMLQLKNSDLLHMLDSQEAMRATVEEGLRVIDAIGESRICNQEGSLQQSYYPGPTQHDPP